MTKNITTQTGHGTRSAVKPPKSLVWKPKKSPFYHMDFKVKGQRVTGSTKLSNKREAYAYAKSERDKVIALHVKLGAARGRDMTILAAADRYYRERGQFTTNPGKIEANLDWLVDRIGEKTRISQIDDEMLARLMAERREMFRWDDPKLGKVSATTVNQNVLDMVRLLLSRARMDWKVPLPDEPNYKRHRLDIGERVKELKIREEFALSTQRQDYWGLCEFVLATGLRKRDALLKWSQVDWDEGVLRLATKGKKHKKNHEVQMTPEVRRMLLAQQGFDPEFVWTYVETRTWKQKKTGLEYREGERYPVTYNRFSGNFRIMCNRAGVKDIRIHDLRKTAGARMHRATGDLVAVQSLLGHANISLTRKHYVHISGADVRKRMAATAAYYARKKAEALKGGIDPSIDDEPAPMH